MFCGYCGQKIEENERFCKACGRPVNQDIQDEKGDGNVKKEHITKKESVPEHRWGIIALVCVLVICIGVGTVFGILHKKDHPRSAAVKWKTVSKDLEPLEKKEDSSAAREEKLKKRGTAKEVQQAYYDYITGGECNTDDYPRWTLVYVDDDDIPELFMAGSCEGNGCLICCYDNGEVKATTTSRSMLSYIPRKNLVLNPGGNMGFYYDYVYKIIDGEFKLVSAGEYYEKGFEDGDMELDEDGNLLFVYEWNGKSVTKEEYDAALQSIYNQDEELDSYEGMTFYEVDEADCIFDFEE